MALWKRSFEGNTAVDLFF